MFSSGRQPPPPQHALNPAEPSMAPRKTPYTGGKLRKRLSRKQRDEAEQRLAFLGSSRLRLLPFSPPHPLPATHEAALRAEGLLYFVRLDLSADPRFDLVAPLIAYYDPVLRRSFVRNTRIAVSRSKLAHALLLPAQPKPAAAAFDGGAASVSTMMAFLHAYVLLPFQGDDACILPPEVAAAEQAVKEGAAHKVDWAGLIWGLVKKEIVEAPKKDGAVCYFAAHLQRLIWVQKPGLFEELGEGETGPEASVDAEMEEDGDVDVRSKDLEDEPDARLEEVESGHVDGRCKNLEELGSGDADGKSMSLVKMELVDVDGPGNGDAKINSMGVLDLGYSDVKSKGSDELEPGSEDARSNSMDVLALGNVDVKSKGFGEFWSCDTDVKSKGLKEMELSDAIVNSKSLEELESRVADATGKSLETLQAGGVAAAGEAMAVEETVVVEVATEEEEEDAVGLSLPVSGANVNDSMDRGGDVRVENVDDDSDNDEGKEDGDDAFEECKGVDNVNWRTTGDERMAYCLQRCNSSSFGIMEFENVSKGTVVMQEAKFSDGFPGEMVSLDRMASMDLVQAMNTIPITYNVAENAHELSSRELVGMCPDVHKNGVDLGVGSSLFFGNSGKRHIVDVGGYNGYAQDQELFPSSNHPKRIRSSSSISISPGSAEFNASFSEPIQSIMKKASMSYEQKELELQNALLEKQCLTNLLQHKDVIIQSLHSARLEQQNKWQAEVGYYKHELQAMAQLATGYKKALKQSRASFAEYRKKFPCDKPRYADVAGSGGLVLSVRELERQRLEKEQKLAMAIEMIEKFEQGWLLKLEELKVTVQSMSCRKEALAKGVDLLKETIPTNAATRNTEE